MVKRPYIVIKGLFKELSYGYGAVDGEAAKGAAVCRGLAAGG
jgi:hypothetical protein